MYFPEDEIIKQNDSGKALYFLEKGNLNVFIEDDEKKRRKFVQ